MSESTIDTTATMPEMDWKGEPREAGCDLAVSVLSSLDWDGDGEMRYSIEPEDLKHDNRRRAGFALVALHAYAKRLGGAEREEAETHFGDLLGDMIHLADALEIDFEGAMNKARGNYADEAQGV